MKKSLIIILFIYTMMILSSCSTKTLSITSIEELYNMDAKKSYVLETDLDLEGREWVPLAVKNFDGQEHVIKNFSINNSILYDLNEYLGFFSFADNIKNLKIENVNIKAILDNTCYIGTLVGRVYENVENVEIDNCNVQIKVGDCQSISYGSIAGDVEGKSNNISVNNSKSVIISEAEFDNIGGVIGNASSIVDVYGNNIILDANINSEWSYLGLIVGKTIDKINNVNICDSKLNVDSTKTYSEVNIGGIAGKIGSSDILNVSSENNNIDIESMAENAYIGGCFGYSAGNIKNALANSNEIKVWHSKNLLDEENYYVGGLIGYQDKSVYLDLQNISYSVSENNLISVSSGQDIINNVYNAGFSGYTKVSIYHSLVNNNSLGGWKEKEIFTNMTTGANLVNECYVSSSPNNYLFSNNCNIEIIDDIEWQNVLKNLDFDLKIWSMKDNNIILRW